MLMVVTRPSYHCDKSQISLQPTMRPHSLPAKPTSPGTSEVSAVLDSTETELLLAKLHRALPYSVPLYRRIQFHLHHPNPPHAHVFLAIALPTSDRAPTTHGSDGSISHEASSTDSVSSWLRSNSVPQKGEQKIYEGASSFSSSSAENITAPAWLAAHVDLTTAGQTQVWIYASWEPLRPWSKTSPSTQSTSTSESAILPPESTRKSLLSTLTTYIHTHLIPQQPTTPPAQWLSLVEAKKLITTPYSRSKILFGSIHQSAIASIIPKHVRSRADPGYLVYIFRQPRRKPKPKPEPEPEPELHSDSNPARRSHMNSLPKGYKFAPLQTQHLQAVLDRTPIPRTLKSLQQYVGVGLYHRDSSTTTPEVPIGWAFLGKDASLTSLHTEPSYRGRGFAVSITQATLDLQGCVFPDREEDGIQYSYACVSEENSTSRRVMEKLDGRVMWKVCWVELDLDLL